MSCHFLFENHKSKLQVGRAQILACSFCFWPLSQLFDRLLCFLPLFQEPLSGGLFGLWICKWKTWWCLSTEQSDSSANCQPPGVYGHRTNSLLKQTVLMLSTLRIWKNRNHLTKLFFKRETLQGNLNRASLVRILLSIKNSTLLRLSVARSFPRKIQLATGCHCCCRKTPPKVHKWGRE